MDKPVLIIGHQHPDTDSVCSAIAYAYLKKQQGPASGYRLGLLGYCLCLSEKAAGLECGTGPGGQAESGNGVCAGLF